MLQKCSVQKPDPASSRNFNYYKDTKSLYSSLTTSAGLSTSLQADYSLSFTLDSASKGISGFEHTVTGNSLLMVASTHQTLLNKDCINNPQTLDKHFLADFVKLPITIPSPWLKNSWTPYNLFLAKYGSHVVTSITFGSMINQMAFAETSENYSERDFQVKSCLSLAGPTEVGKLNVSLCGGIDKSEISRVTSMTMSDQLVVRGGTPDTRNHLIQERTPELITKFMNEANTTNSTIKYGFKSVWDILQVAFAGIDQDNLIRAINLEYYYLGYLNYGCDYRATSTGVVLQKFDQTSTSTPESPQYQCSLGPEGCHSDDDCHYKPIWCSCRGSSCIHYDHKKLSTGGDKVVAYANTDEDWGWHGCGWKKWAAGFKCICYEPHVWQVVWSGDNKDALFSALNRGSMRMTEKKGEETKEETKEEL